MALFVLHTQTAVSDTDLLRKNNELGDIFAAPREVEFAFETGEMERARQFAEFVNGMRYGRAEVAWTKSDRFQILVLIMMPVSQNPIYSVSGFMLCLSKLFQIDYPGCRAGIQKL